MLYTEEVHQQFLSCVNICEHGETCRACCWEWKGGRSGAYGVLVIPRHGQPSQVILAHRLALEFQLGEYLGRAFSCHTCDNPPCCNSAHLYKGDSQSNSDDKIARGRWRGNSSARWVVRYDFVALGRRIAGTRVTHGWTQRELALRAGLSQHTIAMIELGKKPNMAMNTAVRIAEALRISLRWMTEVMHR